MKHPSESGFSLLEVMIVVAIIGILSAIAYPSYTQYVLRGNRSEGMAMLMDAAARQERYYAQNNSYVTAQADIGDLGLRHISGTTVTSETGKYTLGVDSVADDGGYTLTGTPIGPQTRDTQCLNLTINAIGTRGISAVGGSVNDCWR
ncbi:MAG: type IV pilin protein [Pseudomonas sp.]